MEPASSGCPSLSAVKFLSRQLPNTPGSGRIRVDLPVFASIPTKDRADVLGRIKTSFERLYFPEQCPGHAENDSAFGQSAVDSRSNHELHFF
jgi:hypothetical protein